jgi:N-acetylneuraminic acid mutarotase
VGGYDGISPQRIIYSTKDGRHFRRAGVMPVGLRYAAAAATASTVIIAGGVTSGGPSDRILSFDPASGRVRTIGHLPRPLGHAVAFSLSGAVYVAGGTGASGSPLRGIEAVDPTTGEVRAAGHLPAGLSDAAARVIGEEAWVIGGWRGGPVSDVLVLTPGPLPAR